jgi:16S rRNA processing protein RimM
VGDDALLEVGRISKAHGLRGEVIVALITDRDERVAPGSVLTTDRGPLEVVSSRPHQHRWIVQFAGVDGRAAAEALHGTVLRAAPLDDPDALWVHEVIGAEAVLPDGTLVGRVESIQVNPADDLLVLASGSLVPMAFVVGWDEGHLVIDPPEGLLDL